MRDMEWVPYPCVRENGRKNGAEAKNQAKHCEYMQYFAWFSDMLCYLGLLCLPGSSWR